MRANLSRFGLGAGLPNLVVLVRGPIVSNKTTCIVVMARVGWVAVGMGADTSCSARTGGLCWRRQGRRALAPPAHPPTHTFQRDAMCCCERPALMLLSPLHLATGICPGASMQLLSVHLETRDVVAALAIASCGMELSKASL